MPSTLERITTVYWLTEDVGMLLGQSLLAIIALSLLFLVGSLRK